MSEDEAKQKWCPFVRHGEQSISSGDCHGGVNRYGHDKEQPTVNLWNSCLGSACMAWREQNYIDDNRMPNVRGYCGLAGKP